MLPEEQIIISAASQAYERSLLALIGSLDANWPGHPPLRVYDLGMRQSTVAFLEHKGISVCKVPPFCAHWNRHFTWKIWAWNEAPASQCLWIDAGIVVLKPLPDILMCASRLGYFCVPNGRPLTPEASLAACEGCGVPSSFCHDKCTIAGGLLAFDKRTHMQFVIKEAIKVALVEHHIMATDAAHRHDQAILSLLMYKHFDHVVFGDARIYLNESGPSEFTGQKIWVHRRQLSELDHTMLVDRIGCGGNAYLPSAVTPWKPKGAWGHTKWGVRRSLRWLAQRVSPQKESIIYDGVRDPVLRDASTVSLNGAYHHH